MTFDDAVTACKAQRNNWVAVRRVSDGAIVALVDHRHLMMSNQIVTHGLECVRLDSAA